MPKPRLTAKPRRAAKPAAAPKAAPAIAPVVKPAAEPSPKSLRLLQRCCQALDDKKAVELRVLDVSGQSSITNFLIIATATSGPHLKALRQAITDTLKEEGAHVSGVEFGADSGWLVVDAFEFMAHLFVAEQRDNYRLESLWKDARVLDTRDWLKIN
jgi:ribosome-associated protein